MIDDQPITEIPEICQLWKDDTRSKCGGQIAATKGFWTCARCGVSYGPVEMLP